MGLRLGLNSNRFVYRNEQFYIHSEGYWLKPVLIGTSLLAKFNKNIVTVDFYFVRSRRFCGRHASCRAGFDVECCTVPWTLDLASLERAVAESAAVMSADVVETIKRVFVDAK